MIYDYIVIGGGIAGLYAAAKLSYKYKVLLVEKNDKLGGRVEEVCFNNFPIKLGAGIAALNNKHLLKIIKQLNIKYNVYTGDMNLIKKEDYYTKQYHNKFIKVVIAKTKELKRKNIKYEHLTVKEFLLKYFPKKDVDNFLLHCEYNDFLQSDVDYHIKYYPIIDNKYSKYKIVFLKWSDIVTSLTKIIKDNKSKIILSEEVTNIKKINDIFKINSINNDFEARNIIFALTLKPLNKLINKIINLNYNNYLGTVPFVRIYTYHKKGHKFQSNNIDYYNIIAENNPLQKIIIMENNFLMASYSDNDNALFWKKFLDKDNKIKDKQKLIETVTKYLQEINKDITKIDDIIIQFWEEGVHYFKPLNNKLEEVIDKLSKPAENIYVVGEMLSLRQGWVEGAVESVGRTLSHQTLKVVGRISSKIC